MSDCEGMPREERDACAELRKAGRADEDGAVYVDPDVLVDHERLIEEERACLEAIRTDAGLLLGLEQNSVPGWVSQAVDTAAELGALLPDLRTGARLVDRVARVLSERERAYKTAALCESDSAAYLNTLNEISAIIDADSTEWTRLPARIRSLEPLTSLWVAQRTWSRETFGPGTRTAGLADHLHKEIDELAAKPYDLSEWADLGILLLDGLWRHGINVSAWIGAMKAKQEVNRSRKWPDWRTAPEGKAIEHIRDSDVVAFDADGNRADLRPADLAGRSWVVQPGEPSAVEQAHEMSTEWPPDGSLWRHPDAPYTFSVRHLRPGGWAFENEARERGSLQTGRPKAGWAPWRPVEDVSAALPVPEETANAEVTATSQPPVELGQVWEIGDWMPEGSVQSGWERIRVVRYQDPGALWGVVPAAPDYDGRPVWLTEGQIHRSLRICRLGGE